VQSKGRIGRYDNAWHYCADFVPVVAQAHWSRLKLCVGTIRVHCLSQQVESCVFLCALCVFVSVEALWNDGQACSPGSHCMKGWLSV
jgi:hypothetical protein